MIIDDKLKFVEGQLLDLKSDLPKSQQLTREEKLDIISKFGRSTIRNIINSKKDFLIAELINKVYKFLK